LRETRGQFDKSYLYGSWASAYYWQGKYKEAWEMVKKQRLTDSESKLPEKFLNMLRQKMPEPTD